MTFSAENRGKAWSGREDSNLRPLPPEDSFGVTVTPEGWTVHVAFPDATRLPKAHYDLDSYRGPRVPSTKASKPYGLSAVDVRRIVLVEIRVDEAMNHSVAAITPTPGRIARSLTHGEADAIVADPGHDDHGPLATAMDLAWRLRARRRSIAGIAADAPLPLSSGEIVNEMMVLANTALAALCNRRGIPILYLNQPMRDDGPALELPSTYSTIPSRHPTLAVDAYAKFTSPLRRGVDMVNQHALLTGIEPRILDRIGSRISHARESARSRKEAMRRRLETSLSASSSDADGRRIDAVLDLLAEGGSADRTGTLRYVAARMAADDLRRSELVALSERALELLGREPHEVVERWIHDSPARMAMLRGPDALPVPDPMSTPANEQRIMRLASRHEASWRLFEPTISGHAAEALYVVTATWKSDASNHEIHGVARTARNARSEAVRLLLARIRDDDARHARARPHHAAASAA